MKHTPIILPGNRPSHPTANTGLTLIELLVAIALGAILMTGAIQLFVNNRATYEMTTDMSRLQENARFALQAMVNDIRMAGYIGCNSDFTSINNNTGLNAGQLADPTFALEGLETNAANWSPSNYNGGATTPVSWMPGNPNGFLDNSDAITVRYLASNVLDANANGTLDMAVTNAVTTANPTINIDNPITLALLQGEVAAISDCASTDVFIVNGTGANSVTANGLFNNTTRQQYAPSTSSRPLVGRFIAARYFLRNNVEGIPSLFRVSFATTPAASRSTELPLANQEELVDGVRSMQILYGIDADDDGVPDQYVSAGAVGLLANAQQWLSVVSVRIALLMETVDAISKLPDPNTYQVGDVSFCANPPGGCDVTLPADNRRRRVFQTTILVRNNKCRLSKKTPCPAS